MTQHSPSVIDNETGEILNEDDAANQTASDIFGNEANQHSLILTRATKIPYRLIFG